MFASATIKLSSYKRKSKKSYFNPSFLFFNMKKQTNKKKTKKKKNTKKNKKPPQTNKQTNKT